MLAAITREMDEAIIRARPDQIFLYRRFDDGEYRVVNLNAGVVLGDRAAGRRLLLLIIFCEVRADDLPAHAAVVRFEEHFAGEVQGLRVMRRKDDGLCPLKAVLHIRCGPSDGIDRPGIDGQGFAGAMVVTRDLATIRTG